MAARRRGAEPAVRCPAVRRPSVSSARTDEASSASAPRSAAPSPASAASSAAPRATWTRSAAATPAGVSRTSTPRPSAGSRSRVARPAAASRSTTRTVREWLRRRRAGERVDGAPAGPFVQRDERRRQRAAHRRRVLGRVADPVARARRSSRPPRSCRDPSVPKAYMLATHMIDEDHRDDPWDKAREAQREDVAGIFAPRERRCPECGAEQRADGRKCTNCGADLTARYERRTARNTRRPLLFAGIVAAVLIAVAIPVDREPAQRRVGRAGRARPSPRRRASRPSARARSATASRCSPPRRRPRRARTSPAPRAAADRRRGG